MADWGNDPIVNNGWGDDPVASLPAKFVGPSPYGGTNQTPQEELLSTTSVGRVLDAFGEGAADGWGDSPIGLSPDSEKWLKSHGVFDPVQANWKAPLRAFNEGLIRPAASAVDAFLRAGPAVLHSVSKGAAQIGEEVGLLDPNVTNMADPANKKRFEDSLNELLEIGSYVTGGEGMYMGTRIDVRKAQQAKESLKSVVEDPKKPADPLAKPAAPSGFAAFDVKAQEIAKKNQAQPITPLPAGANPKFTRPDGTVDTAQIGELNDVYAAIEEMSQANQGYGPLATRGTVTWAQTEDLAYTAGVKPEVLLNRGIGDAWNATQLEGARNLLVQGADELVQASRKARATGSDADVLAAVEAYQKASLYNEAVTGLKTEAGRALNILKKHKSEMEEVQQLSDVLKDLGGKASWDEILDALNKMDNDANPAKVNKFIQDMNKPGAKDMVLEYLYNAMLSNPVTHTANLMGNSLMAFWDVGETALVGAAHSTMSALGAKRAVAVDRAYLGEAGAKLFGLIQGAPEGLRLAWRAVQEGKTSSTGKLETTTYRKVTTPDGRTVKVPVEIQHAIANPSYSGVYFKDGQAIQTQTEVLGAGSIIRTPTTLLMAADEVFKAMGYRASLNAQAYRKAAKKGLKGQDFKDHVAKLVSDPTKKMMEEAQGHADYITFTSELGKTGKAAQNLLAQHPTAKFVVAPFFRTPVNLLKRTAERTPLGFFSTKILENMTGKNGAAARDMAYARVLLGSGVTGTVFWLASQGRISGSGPEQPAERAMWLLAGNQPYSIKLGETWYSYARLDPIATLFGIGADAYEIRHRLNIDDAANIGTLLAYSASQNVLNKTWLKGIIDPVEAFTEPERRMDRYIQSLLTRTVPSGSAQLARMDDPYLRDARNLLDAFKVKTPGKSQEVYAKRDIFGNGIKREGAFGPDLFSPVFQTIVNKDPVVQELVSLSVFPDKPDRKIRGVELNEKQYDDYQRISGRLLYFSLNMLVQTPGWQNIPEGLRIEILTGKINQSREQARTLMLMQNPDILVESMKLKNKHLKGE